MTLSRWALLAPLAVVLGACHTTTTRPPARPNAARTSQAGHPGGRRTADASQGPAKVVAPTGPQTLSAAANPRHFILVDGVAMQAAATVARRLNPRHQSLYSNLPENKTSAGTLTPATLGPRRSSPTPTSIRMTRSSVCNESAIPAERPTEPRIRWSVRDRLERSKCATRQIWLRCSLALGERCDRLLNGIALQILLFPVGDGEQ